jgi:hypothetical protein
MAKAPDIDDQRVVRPVGDRSVGREPAKVNSVWIHQYSGRPRAENGLAMCPFLARNGNHRRG